MKRSSSTAAVRASRAVIATSAAAAATATPLNARRAASRSSPVEAQRNGLEQIASSSMQAVAEQLRTRPGAATAATGHALDIAGNCSRCRHPRSGDRPGSATGDRGTDGAHGSCTSARGKCALPRLIRESIFPSFLFILLHCFFVVFEPSRHCHQSLTGHTAPTRGAMAQQRRADREGTDLRENMPLPPGLRVITSQRLAAMVPTETIPHKVEAF